MNWFTSARTHAAASRRPWLPQSLPSGRIASDEPDPQPLRSILFDEGELARLAAATAARAARDARDAAAAEPPARQAQALDLLATALSGIAASQSASQRASIDHIVRLAAVIARAAGPAAGSQAELVDAIERLLGAADQQATATLAVAPEAAEALRPLLPDLARRSGFHGSLEIEVDAQMPAGGARLAWVGGWLEHDPTDIAGRIAGLLAAAAPPVNPPLKGDLDDHADS